MDFSEIKLRNIDFVVRYKTTVKRWKSSNLCHIIGITLSGSSFHDFGYQTFTLEKDCIYFINLKDTYTVENLEIGESLSIHFSTYEPIDTDSFYTKINNSKDITHILEKIETQKLLSSQDNNLLFSLFYKLCNEFDIIKNKQYFSKNPRISKAREYFDLHFTHKNCLEEGMKICSITQRRFNDIFKEHYLTTPNRYIINKKIEYAKKLLKSSNLSIKNISELCGFDDVYYFSKIFKKETLFSPSKYRNNVLGFSNNKN